MWASSGHLGALFQGEIHNYLPPTSGGYATLKSAFGITFGYERVVIYTTPHLAVHRMVPDPTRTALFVDKERLRWEGFGAQFRAGMPPEIAEHIERSSPAPDRGGALAGRVRRVGARLRTWRSFFGVDPFRALAPRPSDGTDAEPAARGLELVDDAEGRRRRSRRAASPAVDRWPARRRHGGPADGTRRRTSRYPRSPG